MTYLVQWSIIQTDISKINNFLLLLQKVNKALLKAIDNSVPLEYLEQKLESQLTSYNVMMVFQLENEQPLSESKLFQNIQVQANSCETTLDIYMSMSTVETNRLIAEVCYPKECYNEATVIEFVKLWNDVVVKVMSEPMLHLSSLLHSAKKLLNHSPNPKFKPGNKDFGALYINGRSCTFEEVLTAAINLNSVANGGHDVIGIYVQDFLNIARAALAALLEGKAFVIIEYNTAVDQIIQIINATNLSVLIIDSFSTSYLKTLSNATRLVDMANLLESCSGHTISENDAKIHIPGKLQCVYEIEDGNLMTRWITQADIESTNDIVSKYVASKEGNIQLQVLIPYNSVLFPLALMLYIHQESNIHIYTSIGYLHSAVARNAGLILPSNCLLPILDEIKKKMPQLVWLHGPPLGQAFLLNQFPEKAVVVSQSLTPSQYLVTHYFELSTVKEAITNQSSYVPLGWVSSTIPWKLVGVSGNPLQNNNADGMFVASCENFEVISEKVVWQLSNGCFVLVAQTWNDQTSNIVATAIDKHPEIMWASVTEDSILYTSTSCIDLKKYITTNAPAAIVPPILEKLDKLPLTTTLSLDVKKIKLIISEYTAAKAKCSLDTTCFITHTSTELLQDILGFENIDYARRFQSLGGHSLQAMQFAAILSDKLKFSVTIQSIFEAHSIGSLIQMLHEQAISEGYEVKCQCLQDEALSINSV